MDVALAVVAGLAVAWLALVAALVAVRPRGGRLAESVRLLPDVVRLLRALSRDPLVPRPVRWRVVAVLAYLALPIDLVPDFVPVLGYADDAIVVAWVLRSVVRRAGRDALERNWRGSGDGLEAVARLTGVSR